MPIGTWTEQARIPGASLPLMSFSLLLVPFCRSCLCLAPLGAPDTPSVTRALPPHGALKSTSWRKKSHSAFPPPPERGGDVGYLSSKKVVFPTHLASPNTGFDLGADCKTVLSTPHSGAELTRRKRGSMKFPNRQKGWCGARKCCRKMCAGNVLPPPEKGVMLALRKASFNAIPSPEKGVRCVAGAARRPRSTGRGCLMSCGDIEPNPGPGPGPCAGPITPMAEIACLVHPDDGGLGTRLDFTWALVSAEAGPSARFPDVPMLIGSRIQATCRWCKKVLFVRSAAPLIGHQCQGLPACWETAKLQGAPASEFEDWEAAERHRELDEYMDNLFEHEGSQPGSATGGCPPKTEGWLHDVCQDGDVQPNPGPHTEDYMLLPKWRDAALKALACPRPNRDAFAARHNRQFPLFWDAKDNAFSKVWLGPRPLWMNPPFSVMHRVWTHFQTKGGHAVVVCPEWSPCLPRLRGIAKSEFRFPADVPLFLREGKHQMPPPKWMVWAFYIREGPPCRGMVSDQPTQPLRWHSTSLLRTGRGCSLLSCGDVEANPGPTDDDMEGAPFMEAHRHNAILPLAASSSGARAAPSQGGPMRRRNGKDRERPIPLGEWNPGEDPIHVPAQVAPPPEVDLADPGIPRAAPIRLVATRAVLLPARLPMPVKDILALRAPTIRHVPSKVQGLVSEALAAAVNHYLRDPSDVALFALLAFPKLTLRPVNVRGKFSVDMSAATISTRVQRFLQGDLEALCEEVTREADSLEVGVETRSKKRARTGGSSESEPINPNVLRRVRQLVAEGAPRKALQVLNSSGIHDPEDPAVWKKLQQLHPDRNPPEPSHLSLSLDTGIEPGEDNSFWCQAVRDAILHFPRGSAPGPNGLRPSHLQDALRRRGGGASLITALGALSKRWADGLLPAEHGPFWCGANLTPLRKADNGVRPVAVGDTLRRLVGKTLLSMPQARAQVEQLAPTQVGVGVRGAAEGVAMGFNNLIRQQGPSGQWVALKVDMTNAFNCVDRATVLRNALTLCPTVYNYLRFAYALPAPLFCQGKQLESRTGTHQGCPLGPLGFSLGIQPILSAITAHCQLMWNVWYLDDGLLVGEPRKVVDAFTFIEAEMSKVGLSVNRDKCSLWGPGAHLCQGPLQLVPRERWDPSGGTVVLGVPVSYPGSSQFTREFWGTVTTKLRDALSRITAHTDAQLAHHLLRKCMDACKVNHLLRATDCYDAEESIRDCNKVIVEAFEDILGSTLPPLQRVQLGLPMSAGGCGVRCPLTVRPAARIAALATFYTRTAEDVGVPEYARQPMAADVAAPLSDLRCQLGSNFDPLPRWAGDHAQLSRVDDTFLRQKWWSEQLGIQAINRLMDGDVIPPRDRMRLLEQRSGVGTAFMSVKPSQPLQTLIPPDQYRLGLRWWLGLPLVEAPTSGASVRCVGCDGDVDIFGDHLLCCRRNNFQKRHTAVQEAIANMLTDCGQGFSLEVPVPNTTDASLRPADILLRTWSSGMDTAVDLTVVHGWQQQERLATKERWRAFLRTKEEQKHKKYDGVCDRAGWKMLAMAFGTWGGMGPEGTHLLQRLVRRAAGWFEEDLRSVKQFEVRCSVGLALSRQVWKLLENKQGWIEP